MTNKSIFKSFDCYLQLYLKGTARNLRATPRAFYQSDVIIIIQWLYISDHWKLVLLLSSEQTVSGFHVCIHLSSLMEKAKISHALYHIVSVYFLEVCQATWHL